MASLPFEIITEILTRLPVKPLIRFKCVSKPWNSLISSPKFTKHHLISNPNTKNLVFMYKGTLCTATLFNSDTNSNNLRVTELNHPFKRLSHRPDVGLVESINGVLFMLDTPNKETLLLYNPSIDSCRLIPDRTPPPANLLCYEEVFGFGYDSLHDDYKVVRLQQWKVHGFGLSKEASVYSLRDNVWKSVKDETMPFFLQMSHGVAGNEMLHFPTLTMSFEAVLKCFDLRTNALLIVDYPELDTDDLGKMNMSPMELRGRFTLLVSYRKQSGMSMRHPLETGGFKYADLWEMRERGKKESWVKLFRIKKSEIVERCGFLRLVTYSKDERYVLLEVNGKRFGWYDLVSKRMEKVAVQGIEPDNDAPYVATTFVESLFSLSDKVVPKGGTNDKAARRSLLRRLRSKGLGRGSSLRFDQIRIITDRAWYNVRCGY